MRWRLLLMVGFLGALGALAGVGLPPFADGSAPPEGTPKGGSDKETLPGIVFVGAPIFDEKTDGGEGVYQGSYHWRDGYVYPRSATYNRAERTMGPQQIHSW